ncbi:MAG: transcription-repair coupling factor [Bacteroidetes bacterium]|nr:transcription-repair coupling factor [Bacteroidota bacterium]
MNAEQLLAVFQQGGATRRIQALLGDKKPCRIHLRGLVGSARSYYLAAVFGGELLSHFTILPDKESAAYFLNDLERIFDDQERPLREKKVLFFPSSYRRKGEINNKDSQAILQRTEVLNRLSSGHDPSIIVTYPEAIGELVISRQHLEKNRFNLKKGERVSLDFLTELLSEYHFERVDFVYEPGQFSIRGGIIDVYSFLGEHPYRIELWGDKVESLRSFDPSNQLSIKTFPQITLIPELHDPGEGFTSIFSYLDKEKVVFWIEDPLFISDRIEMERQAFAMHRSGQGVEYLITGADFRQALIGFSTIEMGHQATFPDATDITVECRPQPSFNKNFDLFFENLINNNHEGITNVLLADNPKQVERIQAIMADIQARHKVPEEILLSAIHRSIHEGFIDLDNRIACYTDHQLFNRYHRFVLRDGYVAREALTLKEIFNLQPGDYITHIDHGVGRFGGLEKIINNRKVQEAIRIIYKNNDILYVSIHSLHRISKYIGKDGKEPELNRLGSEAWNNLKNKTKRKVKDIAKDLIKLYAKRKATKGYACAPDTYLQHELEASFMYEDTPDQVKTTADVKKDLEADFPMDRLLCGDVGFGKTEIAVRAAFKMVAESKQVALLVPTTILALQHYKTFTSRMEGFPCKVDYINRFRSTKEQKQALEDLKNGKTDILIGTHRLISEDVKFQNLGLLIIDEEQKFGVAAKEKIKKFKVNVDTLALTATPIPRTLQFSLMGARDLSIIHTPPPNRYPVETELHTLREELIRDGILYEISRGGQVFFVHNRIQNIHDMAGLIRKMVPDVSVAVAHGQMEGRQLEKTMTEFIEGDYDVLVATTIIESGLDIPNVNTIFINDAHHYGLSDLHQLRGRVGRSNKKAFCYLLAPPLSVLTDDARKRLKAIEEFSDLGSGFNIAMRDLDIRGAGNILGAEQSGFISEIGFDMYQKILDEAISELKAEDFREVFHTERPTDLVKDCVIETDLEVMIPDEYVNNAAERLILYKELDSVDSEEALHVFTERLIDRFGPIPPPTQALINVLRLRWMAKSLGFEKIVLKREKMVCHFISQSDSAYFNSDTFNRILEYLKENYRNTRMKEDGNKLTMSFYPVPGILDAMEIFRKIGG